MNSQMNIPSRSAGKRRYNWFPKVDVQEEPDNGAGGTNRVRVTLRYSDVDEHHADALKKIARSLPELINSVRNDELEARVQLLVRAYRPNDPLQDVEIHTYENGLILKTEVVGQNPMLNAKAISDNAKRVGIELSDVVGTWLKEAKIFSVNYHGIDLYPAFQFSNGKPLPIIAELLKILRKGDRSSWDIAIWFTSANGWLDGDKPADELTSNPMLVLDAADQHILSA